MLSYQGTLGHIRYDDASAVAADMGRLLWLWPSRPASTEPLAVRVSGRDGGYEIASDWLSEPVFATTPASAACAAMIELARAYLAAHPDYLCLHCAAFETAGRLVIIAGTNRAGKSTVATRLSAQGVQLYCDDILPVDAATCTGVALGIPPRLRLPIPQTRTGALADMLARHPGPSDERYGYVLPPHLAPHGRTAPIGAMILLDRREDGPAGFAPVGRSEALRNLVLRNLARGEDTTRMTDQLLGVMDTIDCVRLVYADLDEAAELISSQATSWPLPEMLPRLTQADDADLPAASRAELSSRIEPDTRFVQRAGISVRDVDGDYFLVDPRDRAVLHLNQIGALVWELLEEPTTLAQLTKTLSEAFPDIGHSRIEDDLMRLLLDFDTHRLVDRRP